MSQCTQGTFGVDELLDMDVARLEELQKLPIAARLGLVVQPEDCLLAGSLVLQLLLQLLVADVRSGGRWGRGSSCRGRGSCRGSLAL